jgi:DNA polymerase-3 subunit gamma/tau
MLSQAAFNALLKTLEEPPPRSLFIFATTDPRKLPQTVLSRVQWFDLKRLGPVELLARLQEITSSESIELPDSVLRSLVREADGSLRDALTLLDRLVSGLGPSICEKDANAILDLIDRRILRDILDPVLARDPAEALRAIRRALEKGIDPPRLAASLLEEIRNLAIARLVKDPAELIDAAPDEVEEIQGRAATHQPETLDRLFRVLQSRAQELAFAQRPEHVLEMAVVRLATLPDSESIAELLRRLESLSGEPPPESGPSPRARPGSSAPSSGPARKGREPRRPSGPSRRPTSESARERPPERGARSTVPPRKRDPETLARMREETKSHPIVRSVIELFDAELRDIQFPEEDS